MSLPILYHIPLFLEKLMFNMGNLAQTEMIPTSVFHIGVVHGCGVIRE